MNTTSPFHKHRSARLLLVLLCSALAMDQPLSAAKAAKDKSADSEGDAAAAPADPKTAKREEKANARADAAKAGDTEARQLARLRERLVVTDDAEWKVIAERITQVEELRRNLATRSATAESSPPADKVKRSSRAGDAAELEALRMAVKDQLPDAEIKEKLARVREAYHQHEAQLAKAQAALRTVLTVRQEAIVVMAGVLPP
jgi:flagellar biosynthesis GTPase FlhF